MKIKKIASVLFLSLLISSFIPSRDEREYVHEKEDITQVWKKFLNIIAIQDKSGFKTLSNQSIRCYLCLENTIIEQEELNKKRETDSDWYTTLYTKDIYIPIDDFIENDYDLIFNEEFVQILKERKAVFYKREIEGIAHYEVLVTTTAPVFNHEGGQHSFQFKKIKGEWKFNEIGTIP
ncbi:hypothetical protein [Aquimarina aquimarini]|uniref:hypothetical protein n=1 Tax=Aquimarina aquimarini TaxID=1191734 RepID=UPI000D55A2DC|nr:hypothetical protein [Aquimarina aquimarini]